MKHKFKEHQILNITTGRLYTEMGDIYNFFNQVIEPGIMTHMLPNAMRAIVPILKRKLPLKYFGNFYNPTLPNGDIEFEFTEKAEFWDAYNALPSSLSLLGTARKK
jgi:hypothetical protein